MLLFDLQAIGAMANNAGIWTLPAPVTTPLITTGVVRPSLAADAIRAVREGAIGGGVELPAEYCAALAARLTEAGL